MHPSIPEKWANKMVQLFNLLRVNYDQGELSVAASPRNLDAWGQLAIDLQDYESAFEITMMNRYADDVEKATVKSHWNNVFGG